MNFKKISVTLAMCVGLGVISTAFSAPVSEQEWEFSPGVVQADAEWLNFTRASDTLVTSNIQSKRTYAPGQPIHVEFDYISWGGNERSGDGISLYLFDASVPHAGTGGYHGGGLGYCRQVGAYVGIGLDEIGTFASGFCEGGDNKNPPTRNSLTIRGSQARGYALTGIFPLKAPLACKGPSCTTRQRAMDAGGLKRVVADLIPERSGPGYTLNVSINGEIIASGLDFPYAAPASMKVGIAGSNGGLGGANHEIRNLQVDTIGDACAPDEGNVALGVPAYISWSGERPINYPFLNDGDRVQKGWNGIGKWSGTAAFPGVAYGLHFAKDAVCIDQFGGCEKPAVGKGAVEMNSVTIYSRQNDGSQQEPTDSSIFTQYGAVDFHLDISEDDSQSWTRIHSVKGNNLVKRSISFPRKKVTNLMIVVDSVAGGAEAASPLVEIEGFNR